MDGDHFKILINEENQHSLWPAQKIAPLGWTETGFTGSKAECVEFVDESWQDMRPKTLAMSSK
ncbi:MbtH family protein [Polynucleobacter necessarius]|uniref:MbtH family protein n=1 Tax=Polynucleobacter necessarius TaxID=576610 RepID=UPI000E0970A5|nr:MbtH family protein [Polynucleobacter necessarius]